MSDTTRRKQPPKNILVVDDAKTMREHLCALLEAQNYRAFPTADGREALTFLLSHPEVDLVVSDIVMPEMDGIALLTKIRNHDALSTLPVILVSGQLDETISLKALSLGANGVFKKPFHAAKLIVEINTQLAAGGRSCTSNKITPD